MPQPRLPPFPTTKYPKGDGTVAAVVRNQLELFPRAAAAVKANGPITWVLLTRRDGDRVLAELSAPDSITDDGYIATWKTRILLAPIALDGPLPAGSDDEGEELDVPIERR